MKNIRIFTPSKYHTAVYREVEPGIFQIGKTYVTSISFEQEPNLGEGQSAVDISQYPLEDILDRFCVFISDLYPALNTKNSTTCYLEMSARTKESIEKLHAIVGKRVYNNVFYENGEECIGLVIE